MSVLDTVVNTQRNHNGGQNRFTVMWTLIERTGGLSRYVQFGYKLEQILEKSGVQGESLIRSLTDALEGIMYVDLVSQSKISQLPITEHQRYEAIVSQAINAVKNGGVVTASTMLDTSDITLPSRNTTFGQNNIVPDVSLPNAGSSQFFTPPAEPIVVEEETVVPVNIAVEETPVCVEPTPTNVKEKGIFMESYEMHELSSTLKKSTNTVKAASAKVRTFVGKSSNLGEKVKQYLETGLRHVVLGENGAVKIIHEPDKLEINFDKMDVLGNRKDINVAPPLVSSLVEVCSRIVNIDIDDSSVEEMFCDISKFCKEIKQWRDQVIEHAENTEQGHSAVVFANAVAAIYNEVLREAWVGSTSNVLPPSYKYDVPVDVVLGVPLNDFEKMYEAIITDWYIDDLGEVLEEATLNDIATRVIKAIKSVKFDHEVTTIGDDEYYADVVTISQTRYNIVVDCKINTTLNSGPIQKICGVMTQYIETIYREIDNYDPTATVYLVGGGMYAKLIGSHDETSNTHFVRVE